MRSPEPGSLLHSQHVPEDVPRADPVAAAIRDLLARVPLTEAPLAVAHACVEALAPLLGSAAISLPATPIPVEVGGSREGLVPLVRFPGPEGEGELWGPDQTLPEAARDELEVQLVRIWSVQQDRAASSREIDQLRFHLAALQQVAHSLAVVRSMEETQQMIVDSAREVFFAWWAAFYQTSEPGHYVRTVERVMRGERLPAAIPGETLRGSKGVPGAPFLPDADAPIRSHFPADLAALAPLELGEGSSALIVLGSRMTEERYSSMELSLLRGIGDASAIALRNSDLLERLRTQAIVDPLTGCLNRRGFEDTLTAELLRARRYDRSVSLLAVDIDHFKAVNDTFGHEVGDHALRLVGGTLARLFRATDNVCRIGGEEFAVILPETPKGECFPLAERARLAIAQLEPDPMRLPRRLTISVGAASYPDDGQEPTDLLRAADRALYRAKASGRNRSELAQPDETSTDPRNQDNA